MGARPIRASEADAVSDLRSNEEKDLLRLVTIGSVDDGKSTLIGRLLHDAHGLYQDQLDAVRRASRRGSTRAAGSASEIDFSLFTDGLLAEREQGITIDVAYRYFSTARRKFILADTPGHVQYTRNMATGASTADVAVILVDARLGVQAQTRRHAQIAALLGIGHVIACVNKMDLVDFDRARFDGIAAELGAIAERLALPTLHPIPVSALAGDNVVDRGPRMPWWTGATLLEHLEAAPTRTAASASNRLRFPVQLVLRPGLTYRGFAGQLASGTIATGDTIVALPSMKRACVTAVEIGAVEVGRASAPMSIAIRLDEEIDVSRGDMFVRADDLPEVNTDFDAELVWMSERPLDPTKTYLLKHTTRTVRAEIEVVHGTDPDSLSPRKADHFALNDIGRVRVHAHAPLFFDAYTTHRVTGAFVVIETTTNATVAAGMIVAGSRPRLERPRSLVGVEERRARIGHSGGVVRVLAPSIEEARDRAFSLERNLFDRGCVTTVIDGDAPGANGIAAACARAGLVVLVAETSPRRAVELDDPREDLGASGWADAIHARLR